MRGSPRVQNAHEPAETLVGNSALHYRALYLASTYTNLGQWTEAEEFEVQVKETRKRVLGEEHVSTLTSIGNRATTYGIQGRWKEAEELEVRVMEISERLLGEEHPDTLSYIAKYPLDLYTSALQAFYSPATEYRSDVQLLGALILRFQNFVYSALENSSVHC